MPKYCEKCNQKISDSAKGVLCRKCFCNQTFICTGCGEEFKSSGRNKNSLCSNCSPKTRSSYWRNKNKERANFLSNVAAKRRRRQNPETQQKELATRKRYYEKLKEKGTSKAEIDSNYYQRNKDKWKHNPEKYQKYYRKNREQIQQRQRQRYHSNLDKSRAYLKKRLQRERSQDLVKWKISHNLRARLQEVAQAAKTNKIATRKALGCSYSQFKSHIESQWTENMSWDNYGQKDGWVFDHVIPLAFFDIVNPLEQQVATYYKNLKPLGWSENSSKRATLDQEMIVLLEELVSDLNLSNLDLIERLKSKL